MPPNFADSGSWASAMPFSALIALRPCGAVGGGAREDDADRLTAAVGGERAKEDVDGQVRPCADRCCAAASVSAPWRIATSALGGMT